MRSVARSVSRAEACVHVNAAVSSRARAITQPKLDGLSARSTFSGRVALLGHRYEGGQARKTKLLVKAEASKTKIPTIEYMHPTWTEFDMGMKPVHWDPSQAKAGEMLTVWFNPLYTKLKGAADAVAFDGVFNGSVVGEVRSMQKVTRVDGSLWKILVQVPENAKSLHFGITDGLDWDDGYKIDVIGKSQGQEEVLRREMGEKQIFPLCLPPGRSDGNQKRFFTRYTSKGRVWRTWTA